MDGFIINQDFFYVISKIISKNIIITNNDEEDELVKNIEILYKNQLLSDLQLSDNEKEEAFLVTKNIIDALSFFREQKPEKVQQLRADMTQYIELLKQLRLKDELFVKNGLQKNENWGPNYGCKYSNS